MWCSRSGSHSSQHTFNNFSRERWYHVCHFVKKAKAKSHRRQHHMRKWKEPPDAYGAHEETEDAFNALVSYETSVQPLLTKCAHAKTSLLLNRFLVHWYAFFWVIFFVFFLLSHSLSIPFANFQSYLQCADTSRRWHHDSSLDAGALEHWIYRIKGVKNAVFGFVKPPILQNNLRLPSTSLSQVLTVIHHSSRQYDHRTWKSQFVRWNVLATFSKYSKSRKWSWQTLLQHVVNQQSFLTLPLFLPTRFPLSLPLWWCRLPCTARFGSWKPWPGESIGHCR